MRLLVQAHRGVHAETNQEMVYTVPRSTVPLPSVPGYIMHQRPGGGGSNGNAPLPPPPPLVLLDPEPNRSGTAFDCVLFALPGMVMENVWPSFSE
jgi:hypothetical protein